MLLEIAAPIILAIGLFGNLISYCVFNTRKLKTSPTFKFLAHLSIIDFLYLFIGLPHIMMIIYTKVDFRNTDNFICSVHSFLTIFLSHLSSNTLAIANVVRCIDIISLNLKNGTRNKSGSTKNWFNIGRVELILLCLMVVLFVFNSHFLLFMRLTDSSEINDNNDYQLLTKNNYNNNSVYLTCFPSKTEQAIYFEFFTRYWPWIDLFLYSYIPFMIMISSTIVIIIKLCQANNNLKKTRRSSLNITQREIEMSELNSLDDHENAQRTGDSIRSKRVKPKRLVRTETKRRNHRNLQVYKLLVSLNIAFFIMVTPLVLSNSLKSPEIENYALFDLVYILAYLNHCLNFVFYSITCELYRKAIREYFLKNVFKFF